MTNKSTEHSTLGKELRETVAERIAQVLVDHADGGYSLTDAADRAAIRAYLLESLEPMLVTVAGLHAMLGLLASDPDTAKNCTVDGLGWAP